MREAYDDTADRVGYEITDRGPWMQTRFGRRFYPLSPLECDVHLDDLSWHLSRIPRFTGASLVPVPVAQHSVEVADLYAELWPATPLDELRAVLLHDASEAYTGDLNRPMKAALEIAAPGAWRTIENVITDAIYLRFGLPYPDSTCLRLCDNMVCAAEKRDFCPDKWEAWPNAPAPWSTPLRQVTPDQARANFLSKWRRLSGGSD